MKLYKTILHCGKKRPQLKNQILTKKKKQNENPTESHECKFNKNHQISQWYNWYELFLSANLPAHGILIEY